MIISFLITFIAGISTLVGFFLVYLNIDYKHINTYLTFFISLSFSIILSLSVLDILPMAIKYLYNYYSFINIILFLFLFLFICFLILKLFTDKEGEGKLYKLGIINMVVLVLHNIPEGIITFISSIYNFRIGLSISLAILIHNIPEGICIAIPIFYASHNKRKAFLYTLIASLAEPFGALISYLFLYKYISNLEIGLMLLFVSVLMFSVALVKLLPVALKYKKISVFIVGCIIGVIIILLNILL